MQSTTKYITALASNNSLIYLNVKMHIVKYICLVYTVMFKIS